MKQLIFADCFKHFPNIAEESVDMILCDLPYGTTACEWDSILPLEMLWNEYLRMIKLNGAIVLTANQPFTSQLVLSCTKFFRYELIWHKTRNSHPFFANKRPLPQHESILVFSKMQTKYNPQKIKGKPHKIQVASGRTSGEREGKKWEGETKISDERFPNSVIQISNPSREAGLHPTQKPVELFEYLIKTYTDPGDLVLDNCAGSMTTAIACMNLNRGFICIESDPKYYKIGKERVIEHAKHRRNISNQY